MNYIAFGIIIAIVVLSLGSMMWMKKKESVLKKKVKTVEELYPGVPFKQVVYGKTICSNANIKDETNKENVVRSNNHVKHPYKRKRKK